MSRLKRHSIFFYVTVTLTSTLLLHVHTPLHGFYAWFIIINILTFVLFGLDKTRAQKGWSRTPETTFHILGFIGAFPAIFAGRTYFRHKTLKKGFIIPMWSLFALQLGIAIYMTTQYL